MIGSITAIWLLGAGAGVPGGRSWPLLRWGPARPCRPPRPPGDCPREAAPSDPRPPSVTMQTIRLWAAESPGAAELNSLDMSVPTVSTATCLDLLRRSQLTHTTHTTLISIKVSPLFFSALDIVVHCDIWPRTGGCLAAEARRCSRRGCSWGAAGGGWTPRCGGSWRSSWTQSAVTVLHCTALHCTALYCTAPGDGVLPPGVLAAHQVHALPRPRHLVHRPQAQLPGGAAHCNNVRVETPCSLMDYWPGR